MNYEARRAALRERLQDEHLDALLVSRLVNVRYLTGFTGTAGRLLVSAQPVGERFVTDGRYATQAEAEVAELPRTVTREDDWLDEAIPDGWRLGVESHDLSWDQAMALQEQLAGREVVGAPGLVEALRVVKDPQEVEAVRHACAIADAAFADLTGWLRTGLTEREVAVRLERAMVDAGAVGPAFPSIVASGPNSAIPHHRPTGRSLQAGDLVKLDFGALADGYHSDMTRMLSLGSPASPLEEVFAIVRRAQQVGLEAVRPGVETTTVDAACRSVIAEAGYGEHFVHGTGHGVGLEIHEAPRLGQESPGTLPHQAVVTVEPGIYLPGVGGVRIEDTVVVGPDGPTVLTTTPKDLVVL